MKTAFVTGINGFTGRYLAEELVSSGWRVAGIGANGSAQANVDYQRLDLADQDALARSVDAVQPDAVVHLAAVAFVGHGEIDELYRVNVMGTRNLLAALSSCRKVPECVILASSANVYGNADGGVLDEHSPFKPANDYAVSKIAMEYVAQLWKDRLPITIVRPFNYTGVGQSEAFLLPKIVAHFRRRAKTIELGNLDVRRDFSDVRAVAEAYRRLLEVQPSGETVNVCSGETHSLQSILTLAEAITGHTIDVRINPDFVRPKEVKELRGDPARLRGLIGDWNTPPLEETLQWMLQ